MKTFYIFLLKSNILVFIPIVLLILVVLNLTLMSLLFPESTDGAENMMLFDGATPLDIFFLAIIIAPLFETTIFQMVVIFISKSIFQAVKLQHYIYPVIISAFLFGIVHFFDLKYFIIATLSGFIYAFAYIIVQKRKENAFFIIALLHALYNLIPYSQEFIFK